MEGVRLDATKLKLRAGETSTKIEQPSMSLKQSDEGELLVATQLKRVVLQQLAWAGPGSLPETPSGSFQVVLMVCAGFA